MRIPTSHFYKAAHGLPAGEQVRINHEQCPAGEDTRQRLFVKRKQDDAVLAYCHNCGGWGIFGSKVTRCIADLIQQKEKAEMDSVTGALVLPPNCSRNHKLWPGHALAWLYKYGITDKEIEDNEIAYSADWRRVVLPVYEDGKLVYWQARAILPDQDPKYVSAKSHPKAMFHYHSNHGIGALAITEDILSAIKLGRHCDTIALLGTSPDIDGLTSRLENYKKVVIALDPDFAGVSKALELERRLSLVFSGTVMCPTLSKQPKEMSNAELEFLSRGF